MQEDQETIFQESIYIIHALQGYELHEARIKEIFNDHNLKYILVTAGDPSLFNDKMLQTYFINSIRDRLSTGVISCTLNHIKAYEAIVSNNQPYAIVFENDPFFLGDFRQKFNTIFPEIKNLNPGFIVSLENSTLRFPSYWQTKKDKYLYAATEGRMAGAYLIDLQGAKNILKDLQSNKCHEVIDWWHNDLFKRGIVSSYWAHPPLVEQGSHNGQLHAGISSKNASFIRKLKWRIQRLYKMYILRLWSFPFVKDEE